LVANKTREKYRVNETDFTRNRVLIFSFVAVLILRGHKFSLQNALNKFFSALGKLRLTPSNSAYCQARKKLKPELFVDLHRTTRDDFYQLYGADDEVLTWRGHRMIGYDCTYIVLPDTQELRKNFSTLRNQHKSECVQALAGVLYDLRNDIALGAAIGRIQAEKNFLLDELWAETRIGDLLVMDRNFADYAVIAHAVKDGREVVIRCPRQCFGVVNDFWASDESEQLVTLTVPQSAKTQKYVRDHDLPESLRVRLIKVPLADGETEVLLTTLCDRRRYPAAEFKQIYHWRWNEETYFDRIKNIFEVERFSGISETAIKQDFFGVVFLSTLESILTKGAQSELAERNRRRKNKTNALVNRAVSYVALVDHVTELLADPQTSSEEVLDDLHLLFIKDPTRNREGRKFERKNLKHSRKLRFHRYFKRINA